MIHQPPDKRTYSTGVTGAATISRFIALTLWSAVTLRRVVLVYHCCPKNATPFFRFFNKLLKNFHFPVLNVGGESLRACRKIVWFVCFFKLFRRFFILCPTKRPAAPVENPVVLMKPWHHRTTPCPSLGPACPCLRPAHDRTHSVLW